MIDWELVRSEIRDHANAAFPAEACGFIYRDPLMVTSVVNVADWPYTQFRIREADTLAAMTSPRCVAMWHSHPVDPAVPSGMDVELAPHSLLYVIYAVADEDLVVLSRVGDQLEPVRVVTPS